MKWKNYSSYKSDRKEASKKAALHRKKHLKYTIISKWRQWSVLHRFRADQKHDKLGQAVNALNNVEASTMF